MYWVSLELRFRVLRFLDIVLSPCYVSSPPAFSGTGANRQTVYGFAKGGTILWLLLYPRLAFTAIVTQN